MSSMRNLETLFLKETFHSEQGVAHTAFLTILHAGKGDNKDMKKIEEC